MWGVCLDAEGDARLPDNWFDLLPSVPKRVQVGGKGVHRPRRISRRWSANRSHSRTLGGAS